jgi:hypothetical protein
VTLRERADELEREAEAAALELVEAAQLEAAAILRDCADQLERGEVDED